MKKLLLSLLLFAGFAQAQTFPVVNLTASGWIRNAAGSNGTPTYAFNGETSTGVYWTNPGIGFSVAGVNVGTLLSTGFNGAIGGTTPAAGAFTTLSATTPLDIGSGGTGNTTGAATVNANLTGVITSVGNATSIGAQTGTGTTFATQASPAFTGNPTAPTQGILDNSTNLATTAFTTQSVGNYAYSRVYNTDTTLTTAAFGTIAILTASGHTITLPTIDGTYAGKSIVVAALMSSGFTSVVTSPITNFYDNFGNAADGYQLQAGESAAFTVDASGVYVLNAYATQSVTNLLGGSAGTIPYQNGVASTSFIGTGSSGQFLTSNGSSAPSWTSTVNTGGAVTGTTLTASSGAITPSYPSGIVGNATGSAVTAGSIGENYTSNISGVALISSTQTNITSIPVTAGNWLAIGLGVFQPGVSAVVTDISAGFTTSSASLGATYISPFPVGGQQTNTFSATITSQLFSMGSSGTIYCVVQETFTGTGATAGCNMTVIRIN